MPVEKKVYEWTADFETPGGESIDGQNHTSKKYDRFLDDMAIGGEADKRTGNCVFIKGLQFRIDASLINYQLRCSDSTADSFRGYPLYCKVWLLRTPEYQSVIYDTDWVYDVSKPWITWRPDPYKVKEKVKILWSHTFKFNLEKTRITGAISLDPVTLGGTTAHAPTLKHVQKNLWFRSPLKVIFPDDTTPAEPYRNSLHWCTQWFTGSDEVVFQGSVGGTGLDQDNVGIQLRVHYFD